MDSSIDSRHSGHLQEILPTLLARGIILFISLLTITIALIIGLYAIKAVRLYQRQGERVYNPRRNLDGNPADQGINYQDIHFRSADNIALHGWFAPCTDSKKVILLFHGNTGNISDCIASIPLFAGLGYSCFMFDYRGYGQSQGNVDEQGSYRDAEAAWEWLLREQHYAPENIVILGRSLGAAIGSKLASKQPAAAVVLESTFTSIPDIAAETHKLIPARWLTRFDYNTLENVQRIRSPILIIHGPDDSVIPYHHGQRLFAAAQEPKAFLDIDSDHARGFLNSGQHYINGLREFLDKHVD